ncbi:unnamed protein product [Rotaria magnacalcarata]|uniref:protein-tyrosine-phosphatase n=3 Tax=Rotaria magnacalcarata TaxID=392030 RepID=A0A815CS76_9BILA|nr:unnamed protein product [Rotaria magnacalcarata]CAF4610767.1 unnamed protein product [Rotaria magnacalcarata]
MLSNDSTLNSINLTISKSLPICLTSSTNETIKCPLTEKRTPLTKAYSCSDAMSSCSNGHFSFISPREFYELMSENSHTHERKYPIVDCRSQIDFGSERIRSSHNVNCRAKIMAKKLMSKRLEEVEPSLSTCLNNSDIVILYDQSTDERIQDKIRSSPINLVIQAANKSNKKVHIIQGGFDAVKNQYPHLIECAIDLIPREKHEHDHLPSSPEVFDKENFTMTQILPRVFVGNVHDAQNLDRLNQNGITHIINSTPDLPCLWEKRCQYMRVAVLDLPSENIRKHFDKTFQFIDEALRQKTNNVLVHCSAGISRSSTIVLAFMIKKYRMTLDDAFTKMRQLRPIVDPNISFIIQLRDWEKSSLLTTETKLEPADDTPNISCTVARSGSSVTYCGSTSKSKTDKNSLTESAIIVK